MHDRPSQQLLLLQPQRVSGSRDCVDELHDVRGAPATTPTIITSAASNATLTSPAAAVASATSTPTLTDATPVTPGGTATAARASFASIPAKGAGIDLLPGDQCRR